MNPTLKKLIETGIPIEEANFHSAVNNGQRVPGSCYSNKSQNKDRQCEMWLNGHLLICLKDGIYFGTSSANIRDFIVKPQTADFFEEAAKVMSPESIIIAEDRAAEILKTFVESDQIGRIETTAVKKRGRPFKNPQ